MLLVSGAEGRMHVQLLNVFGDSRGEGLEVCRQNDV